MALYQAKLSLLHNGRHCTVDYQDIRSTEGETYTKSNQLLQLKQMQYYK